MVSATPIMPLSYFADPRAARETDRRLAFPGTAAVIGAGADAEPSITG